MGLSGLPASFEAWQTMRQSHLEQNLIHSAYTDDLFSQYRKHLGEVCYRLLQEAQSPVAPQNVRKLLAFRNISLLQPLILLYKFSKRLHLDGLIKTLVLPSKHAAQINMLDHAPVA